MIDESSAKALENVFEKIALKQDDNNAMPKIPGLRPGQGNTNLRDKIKEGIGKAVDKLKSLPQKGIPKMGEALSEEEQGKHITLHAFKSEINKTAGFMDWVHGGLDLVGMVPGVGIVADGLNAGLYAAKGDWQNASISGAAMIPGAGQAATALKLTNQANKAKKAITGTKKVVNTAKNTTKKVTTPKVPKTPKVDPTLNPVATKNTAGIASAKPGFVSGRVLQNSKTGLKGRQIFTDFGAGIGSKAFNKIPGGDFKKGLGQFYNMKPGFGLQGVGRFGKGLARFRGAQNTLGQGLGFEPSSDKPLTELKEGVKALPTLGHASYNWARGQGFQSDFQPFGPIGGGGDGKVEKAVSKLNTGNQGGGGGGGKDSMPADTTRVQQRYIPNPKSKIDTKLFSK